MAFKNNSALLSINTNYENPSECVAECSLVRRILSAFLAFLLVFQPIPAYAQTASSNPNAPAIGTITPEPGSNTNVQVIIGVPVVNISAPSAGGVSHNRYLDFNVGTSGAVMNNSAAGGQSKLAGSLDANTNLGGREASFILNEVIGNSVSDLYGPTEIFGGRASYILSNANGIYCDGCGFINTPRVTLTTGRPELDKAGTLTNLIIENGEITVAPGGLEALDADSVELMARAVLLNGKIFTGGSLDITAGRFRADYENGRVIEALAAEESTKPKEGIGIDSKSLGGMYAGKIRLVGTEAGVGVRLAAEAIAANGDMQIDADGNIEYQKITAAQDIKIKSRNASIAQNESSYAGRNQTIEAKNDIVLSGKYIDAKERLDIESGRNIVMFSDQGFSSLAGEISVRAGDSMLIKYTGLSAEKMSFDANNLALQQALLQSSNSLSVVTKELMTLENSVLSANNLSLQAPFLIAVNNAFGGAESIDFTASNTLAMSQVEITAGDRLSLHGGQTLVQSGDILASGDTTITADNDLAWLATPISANSIKMAAQKIIAPALKIFAEQSVNLESQSAIDISSSLIDANDISVKAQEFVDATESLISARKGELVLDTKGPLFGMSSTLYGKEAASMIAGTMWLTSAQIGSEGDLSIISSDKVFSDMSFLGAGKNIILKSANSWSHRSAGDAVAQVIAGGDIQINAGAWEADGKIRATGKLAIQSDTALLNDNGKILSGDAMTLSAGNVLSNLGGVISAGIISRTEDEADSILKSASLNLSADSMMLNNGAISATDNINIFSSQAISHRNALLNGYRNINISAASLDNEESAIQSWNDISIVTTGLTMQNISNNFGGILALGKVAITSSGNIENVSGEIGGNIVKISSSQNILNEGAENTSGLLSSSDELILEAQKLHNNFGAIASAKELTLNLGSLSNSNSGMLLT